MTFDPTLSKTKTVYIHNQEASSPIKHRALDTFQKGLMYCVWDVNGLVYKYPILRLWRVTEGYGEDGKAEFENKPIGENK
jgi:hypothetical protein